MADNRLYLVVSRYARNCKDFDLNAIIAIVGEPGSGKSSLALRIAEILRDKYDFKFSIDNVYFNLLDFLNAVSEKHSVHILDEAGVQLYSRNYMSEINKTINYVTQTFRFKNSVVIFTLPHLRFLDKTTRTLITHIWRTEAVVKNGKVMRRATAFRVKTNYVTDTVQIVVDTFRENGKIETLAHVTWPMPSQNTWEAYIRKKEMYWSRWAKQWEKSLAKAMGVKRNKEKNVFDVIKEVLAQRPDWEEILFDPNPWSKERARVVEKIAQRYGYHPDYIRSAIRQIRNNTIKFNDITTV